MPAATRPPVVTQTILEARCQYFSLTQGFYGNSWWIVVWREPLRQRLALMQLSARISGLTVGLTGRSLFIDAGRGRLRHIDAARWRCPRHCLPSGNAVFGTNCAAPAGLERTARAGLPTAC